MASEASELFSRELDGVELEVVRAFEVEVCEEVLSILDEDVEDNDVLSICVEEEVDEIEDIDWDEFDRLLELLEWLETLEIDWLDSDDLLAELVEDDVTSKELEVDDTLETEEELTEEEVETVADDDDKLLTLREGELLLDWGGMCSFMSKKYQSFSRIDVTGKESPFIKLSGKPSSSAR